MTSTELYYEPWDPACREGLFDTYQRLIREAPVYRAPSGTWVVSSYEGVEYIFNNPDLFSNRAYLRQSAHWHMRCGRSVPHDIRSLANLDWDCAAARTAR